MKASTAGLHRSVERAFDLKRRVATVDGYRDALVRLRRLHGSAAAGLDTLDLAADRSRMAQRLGWLDDDLRVLGAPGDAVSAPPLRLASTAEGLGCLYVLEGSMLGGRYIYTRVSKALGLDAATGARYFWGFGEATGAIWADFVAQLDAMPAAAEAEIEAGARATFALFAASVA